MSLLLFLLLSWLHLISGLSKMLQEGNLLALGGGANMIPKETKYGNLKATTNNMKPIKSTAHFSGQAKSQRL